jgi:4a-hydroxytetrahydrobiopterin dehydratase
MTGLSISERAEALATVPDWRLVDDRDAIERRFTFNDFDDAFAFMSSIAALAKEQDHHPEWFNCYNRVHIVLSTHDAGGLSTRDICLARSIDAIGQ